METGRESQFAPGPAGDDEHDRMGATERHALRARAGNDDDFEVLHKHLGPALEAFVHAKYTCRRPELDAAEIAQDAWAAAWRCRQDYDPTKGRYRAWLFAIAVRVVLSAYRRRNGSGRDLRPPTRSLDDPEEVIEHVTSIATRASRREDAQRIIDAVESMAAEDRDLAVHCGLAGFPLRTAAEALGISEATATKRWYRLRKKLQESPLWRSLVDFDDHPA